MIQVKSLQFEYPKGPRFSFPDFSVDTKDHLLILGKSGIGKTTLLHILAGILPSSKGNVMINETTISQLSATQLDCFRANHMGVVFQKARFIQSLSLLENFQLAAYLAGNKYKKKHYSDLLHTLNMADYLQKRPSQLSEGQQQRASIAMALVNQPSVLLTDEPTSSLDDENCEQVMKIFKELCETHGTTLIIITHDQRIKSHFNNVLTL